MPDPTLDPVPIDPYRTPRPSYLDEQEKARALKEQIGSIDTVINRSKYYESNPVLDPEYLRKQAYFGWDEALARRQRNEIGVNEASFQPGGAEYEAALAGQHQRAKEGTSAVQSQRDRLIRDLITADARMKEGAINQGLSELESNTSAMIDKRLGALLEETGISAGLLRGRAAGAYAERGLGKSSFAAEGLNQITANELSQKAQERTQALGEQQALSAGVAQTRQSVIDRRRAMEQNQNLSQINQAEDIAFLGEAGDIEMQFKKLAAEAELDARQSGFTSQLLGGLAGGIAGIFAGPIGGAIFGGAASKAVK